MNAAVLWEKLSERALQSEFEIHNVPQLVQTGLILG
jgi:hypothetical protein